MSKSTDNVAAMQAEVNAKWQEKKRTMDNREKVKDIINRQVEKLHELSEKQKMPLQLNEIKSLSELVKIVADSESLTSTDKKKSSEFSSEELLMIYEFRQKKQKESL